MNKVWLITGAGRGLGREFALAALRRGDKVAATSRRKNGLNDLRARFGENVLPLILDVTERSGATRTVDAATEYFGRIDVLVNNAGYALFGTVEEITEQQLRDIFEVNFFGLFHMSQAVLPVMREQGSGSIIQISSLGGITASAMLGGYNATKWAVEALSEALAREVAQFGINVTIIEPGGFDTDWIGVSSVRAEEMPVYEAQHERFHPGSSNYDPKGAGPALLKIVDAVEPPLRVFFGLQPYRIASHVYAQRIANWEAWKHLSAEAEGRDLS